MTSKIQADVLKNVNSSVDNLTLGTSGQVTVGGSLNIGGNYNITGSLTLGSALSVGNGGTGLTSLTAGYIPYGNGAGAFSSSSGFVFDGTNLGVGTVSPTARLDVVGTSVSASAITFRVRNLQSSVTGEIGATGSTFSYSGIPSSSVYYYSASTLALGTDSANPTIFFNNGSERMRLDASGNLGLGVTPSNWNNGNFKVMEFPAGSVSAFAGNQMFLTENAYYYNSAWRYKVADTAVQYWQYAGQHIWLNATAGANAGDAITWKQAMTLDSGGSLSINTGRTVTGGSGGCILSFNGLNNDFVTTGRAAGITGSWGTVRIHQVAGFDGLSIIGDTSQTAPYLRVATGAGSGVLTLDASGNLGIGNALPGCKLAVTLANLGNTFGNNVQGFQFATNTGNADWFEGIWVRNANASGWPYADFYLRRSIDGTGGPCYIVYEGAGRLAFWTNNTRAATIDASGNLLVGTTATALSAAPQIAVVGSTTNRGYFVMGRATAATTGVCGSFTGYNGTQIIASIDYAANGANNSGFIQTYTWSAGSAVQGPYVNTGGTSWTTPSDERLKNILDPITGALAKVISLNSIYYTLKSDTTNTRRVGFTAQNMRPVLPEVVSEKADGELGIDYAATTPLLAAAIQELAAKVQALEAKVQ